MPRGGARPGAGRKKGGANRLTQTAVAKAKAEGIMPLDYLLEIMRSETEPKATRIDAAKAAAPYLHPRRQPVNTEGSSEQKITVRGALAWKAPT